MYTMCPPSDVSLFINHSNYSYLRTINHSEIGVMCTNLALERGPHIVFNTISWASDLDSIYIIYINIYI